eukprot:Skav230516  [mRNA]  locus=scaffold4943:87820:89468:+ [translate_table: standard]
MLDGLRLRADAAAEGLASEVRLREERASGQAMDVDGTVTMDEGVLRVETQLQSMTREMEVAMETLRGARHGTARVVVNQSLPLPAGSLEKQLHGMLTSAHSTAEQKQREWQQECQKRQDRGWAVDGNIHGTTIQRSP